MGAAITITAAACNKEEVNEVKKDYLNCSVDRLGDIIIIVVTTIRASFHLYSSQVLDYCCSYSIMGELILIHELVLAMDEVITTTKAVIIMVAIVLAKEESKKMAITIITLELLTVKDRSKNQLAIEIILVIIVVVAIKMDSIRVIKATIVIIVIRLQD